MTDLDREKVIKGLELCNENNLGFQCPSCYCYPLQKSDKCLFKLHEDALALLKAQEPRVMTLEEVLRLKFDDVVYFEMSVAGVVISAIVIDVIEHMPDGDIGLIQFRHIQEPTNNADLEYYGKTWRCWTSRPTDAQREAVKWK